MYFIIIFYIYLYYSVINKEVKKLDSYADVWELVKENCKNQVSDTIYKLWFEPLSMVSFDDNKVILSTNEFQARIVKSKFLDTLNEAFVSVMGFSVDIDIISDFSKQDETVINQPKPIENNNSELSFENFIEGSSNKFAYAASKAVANNPGQAYNPLFIYGNSGLGKTHLLNAICIEIKKNNPNSNIIYANGEDFTNELVKSIQHSTSNAFHEKYRNADVLLLDDVHFIAGKKETQEEFFHTFDALYQDKKQIVLTSDRPPKEIALLEDRIKTRFEWGLLADIQPPDIETRMAIIKHKADFFNLELPDDVVLYIAEKIKSNVRQLEGAVKKLNALCTISGHDPSMSLAQKAIKDILSDNQPVSVTIDKILQEVARTYGTSVENILSEKRNANVTKARQAAMYIVREITSLPMETIGEKLGGKHHSTVIYNIKECEKDMNENSSVKATIQGIINNVRDNNINI